MANTTDRADVLALAEKLWVVSVHLGSAELGWLVHGLFVASDRVDSAGGVQEDADASRGE